jgi:hypothetical protein
VKKNERVFTYFLNPKYLKINGYGVFIQPITKDIVGVFGMFASVMNA